jgi:hypothetical protein
MGMANMPYNAPKIVPGAFDMGIGYIVLGIWDFNGNVVKLTHIQFGHLHKCTWLITDELP